MDAAAPGRGLVSAGAGRRIDRQARGVAIFGLDLELQGAEADVIGDGVLPL